MLLIVTFAHVELSQRWAVKGCVRDGVDLRFRFHHHVSVCVKLCGHRRQSVPGDINEQHDRGRVETVVHETCMCSLCGSRCEVSGVINFRLGQVITQSGRLRFRSSRQSRVYADYYFFHCFKQGLS
jgi:hypothetical protein